MYRVLLRKIGPPGPTGVPLLSECPTDIDALFRQGLDDGHRLGRAAASPTQAGYEPIDERTMSEHSAGAKSTA